MKFYGYDKLILYAVLIFLVSLVVRIIYGVYCTINFKESKYIWFWDIKLFREMTSFAGWNLFGVFAGIGYNQGVNILLNLFFGPIINTSRAIAFQVSGAVNQLVNSFQLAVNPPIIKSYAEKEKENAYKLIFASSKFSYLLLLLFIVPLLIHTDFILSIWLAEVPNSAVLFTRLVLVDVLINSLSGPLQTLAQATGKIRGYQLVVSSVLILNLPISYLLLYCGFKPESTFVVSISLSLIAIVSRLIVLKRIVSFPVMEFVKNVLLNVLLITIITLILPLLTLNWLQNNYIQFIVTFLSVAASLLISVGFIILSKSERIMVIEYVTKIKNKLFR